MPGVSIRMFSTCDSDTILKRETLEVVLDMENPQKNIFVKGPPGTGKTEFLMVAAFTLIMERDSRVLFLAPPGAYELVKAELEKQRNWDKFPEKWQNDDEIGYGFEEMNNVEKKLVIAEILPTTPLTDGFDIVIIDHLNMVDTKVVQELCLNQHIRFLGAYDNSIPWANDSPVFALENGQFIFPFVCLYFPFSNRPDEIMEWTRGFLPSEAQGSRCARVQMEYVNSEGSSEDQKIIEKVQWLINQGVPEGDIGVSAIKQKHVEFLRNKLRPGIRVENLEFWNTATVDHFLVSLSSWCKLCVGDLEVNLILTRARKSLTVFGGYERMVAHYWNFPYFMEFMRIITEQEPEVEEVYEPIKLPENWNVVEPEPVPELQNPVEQVMEVQNPQKLNLEDVEEFFDALPCESISEDELPGSEGQDSEAEKENDALVVPAPEVAPEAAPEAQTQTGQYFKLTFPPGFVPPPGLRF